MRLLLTRPEPGPEADPLQHALLARGHRILHAPLLSIVPTGGLPPLDGVQALIATSRNGLRALSALPDTALALPLFAVGPATAALGRELGFTRVIEGTAGARELVELIQSHASPSAGPLVHLSGDTTAFDLKSALEGLGFQVSQEVVYQTRAVPHLDPAAATAIRDKLLDGVVLMSPRTARIYAEIVASAGLAAAVRPLIHFCLSNAVAAGLAPLDLARVVVASLPNSQEMLAQIAREAPDSP